MKSSFTHLVVALLSLALVLGGVWYWYKIIVGESVAVAALQAEIATNTETAERTKQVEAVLEALSVGGNMVQDRFVSDANIVTFLEKLERTGAEIGVTVRVLSVGTTAAKGATGLPVSLSLEGTFDGVMRTIGAIEYSPYAVSISTASLSQLASEPPAHWGASVSLVVSTDTP